MYQSCWMLFKKPRGWRNLWHLRPRREKISIGMSDENVIVVVVVVVVVVFVLLKVQSLARNIIKILWFRVLKVS